MYVHNEARENDVDVPAGTVKESRNDDTKSRDFSPALQPKSRNSIRSFIQKQSGLKESRIPLKRTDSNVTEVEDSNKRTKRLDSVEKTIRKGETEQEWAPDLPFDFSAFGNKFYEQENIIVEQKDETDVFPSLTPRNFTVIKEKEAVALPPFKQEEEIVADFPTPATVEYGPEKEKELPFAPFNADMLQYDQFSAIAALSAYEASDDEVEFIPVFEDDDDYFYLENLFKLDNQEELFFFDVHSHLVQEEEKEDDIISVPFDNHLFDLKLIEC